MFPLTSPATSPFLKMCSLARICWEPPHVEIGQGVVSTHPDKPFVRGRLPHVLRVGEIGGEIGGVVYGKPAPVHLGIVRAVSHQEHVAGR